MIDLAHHGGRDKGHSLSQPNLYSANESEAYLPSEQCAHENQQNRDGWSMHVITLFQQKLGQATTILASNSSN